MTSILKKRAINIVFNCFYILKLNCAVCGPGYIQNLHKMSSLSSAIPFSNLAKLCEKISNGTKEKKKDLLKKYVAYFREFYKNKHGDTKPIDPDNTFFPILRLLLPQLDRERGAYGIKEHTLTRLYIRILVLNKDSSDAKKLINYRAPKTAKASAGDFAQVAYDVLKHRCPEEGKLTVMDINSKLNSLSASHASHESGEVEQTLQELLRRSSALEQKWLIRIILKDMKLGTGQTSILNIFHPDAKDLYDVTNNLIKVCTTLHNASSRLHEVEISLFTPFRPMLAERGMLKKVERQMENKPFYIETKFDGERMQLHKDGTKYQYFSRNGYDYTQNFGGDDNVGMLTPHIEKLFNSNVKNCILDGEMIAWHKSKNTITSKGENVDVKHLKLTSAHQPCYFVFDILYYNSEVLSNKPLKDRLRVLDGLFKPQEGRLALSTRKDACTKEEVFSSLNDAIDNREEGIMLKDPNSVYKPSTRKGGWLKIKPEYTNELMDELDLLIIGGYYGTGHRRGGMISHFLLGLAVPEPDEQHPCAFHSVSKVGSGYTMMELEELLGKLTPHWNDTKLKSPPRNLMWTREKPDVWIEPKNSKIVQIKAAEITQTDVYKSGFTLRFPRVEKVRYDKSWFECMTTTEFTELRQKAEGKLYSVHYVDDEMVPEAKRPKLARYNEPVTLAKQFTPADTTQLKQVSTMFEGKQFVIINGLSPHSKQDLEKLVVQYGGKCVQNPGPDTFCVIAENLTIKAKNIAQSEDYNVVRASWLINCITNQRYRDWSPMDLHYATFDTEKKLSEKYDQYGDSYTEKTTDDSLKYLMGNLNKEKREVLTTEEIIDLEEELFGGPSPYGIFRPCRVYLDMYSILSDICSKIESTGLELSEVRLKFYGATISQVLDDTISHVIVSRSDTSRWDVLRSTNRSRIKKFHIVTNEWISRSIEDKRMLLEHHFEI